MVEKCQTGFKGFDYNFCCQGMQYATNEEFRITNKKKLEMCENGLHFCVKPTDVLGYYPPFRDGARSRYAKVTATGKVVKSPHKCVARKLQIHDEYSLLDLSPSGDSCYCVNETDDCPRKHTHNVACYTVSTVAYAPRTIFESEQNAVALQNNTIAKSRFKNAICLGANSYAYTSGGTFTVSVATEHSSIAETCGGYAVATAPNSLASARMKVFCGWIEHGVAVGRAFAEALSKGDIAITEGSARGVEGSLLVFLLRDEPAVRAFRVDGKKVKANTWYSYVDLVGKVAEDGN